MGDALKIIVHEGVHSDAMDECMWLPEAGYTRIFQLLASNSEEGIITFKNKYVGQ